MEQAQQIERFERLRDWAVLAIWSPGLWLMLPLIIMLQTSALWSPSNRVLDILANIWMIGLFFLMVLCIIGAFAFTNVRSRIETMCGDFDEISRVPHAPQVGPLRVRAVSNSTILVVRHFAPRHVRWIMHSWMSVLCLTFAFELIRSWPMGYRTLIDLLIALGMLVLFFGPAWLLGTWTWVTRIQSGDDQLRISRRSGPWNFGPIRTRTAVLSLPCAAQFQSTGLFLASENHSALIARLPPSSYGHWLGLRLRGWLEELLNMPLPSLDE